MGRRAPQSVRAAVRGRADDRVGRRDLREADQARPRPARRHRARLRGPSRRRRTPRSTPRTIDRAIEIIRERTDTLGVSEPEIARVGGRQGIQVGLPDVQNIDRRSTRSGPPPSSTSTTGRRTSSAARRAAERPGGGDRTAASPACSTRSASPPSKSPSASRTTARPTGRATTCSTQTRFELLAGPAAQAGPLPRVPRREAAAGLEIIEVPQGTVVVGGAARTDPRPRGRRGPRSPPQFFVLRDRPALSGDDITNPEQNSDPNTNQPNVTFDFTDDGRDGVPGGHPGDRRAGRGDAPPGAAGQPDQADAVLAALRGRARRRGRHPADHQLRREPGRDRRAHRGADLGQLLDQEAQDLAEFLRIGALPIDLKLISQSTVSATLGQEALDQGLKAGIVGLILVLLLPDRLLPLARRGRGGRAGSSTRSSSSR